MQGNHSKSKVSQWSILSRLSFKIYKLAMARTKDPSFWRHMEYHRHQKYKAITLVCLPPEPSNSSISQLLNQ